MTDISQIDTILVNHPRRIKKTKPSSTTPKMTYHAFSSKDLTRNSSTCSPIQTSGNKWRRWWSTNLSCVSSNFQQIYQRGHCLSMTRMYSGIHNLEYRRSILVTDRDVGVMYVWVTVACVSNWHLLLSTLHSNISSRSTRLILIPRINTSTRQCSRMTNRPAIYSWRRTWMSLLIHFPFFPRVQGGNAYIGSWCLDSSPKKRWEISTEDARTAGVTESGRLSNCDCGQFHEVWRCTVERWTWHSWLVYMSKLNF